MIPRLEKDWKLKSYLGSAFSSPTNFVGVMAKGRFSPPVAQAIVNVCPDADTVGDALNELYKIALIKDRTESVLYNVLFVKLIEEMTPIKRREKLSIFYGAMKDDKAPMVVLDPITHDATCFLIYKPFHDDVKDETVRIREYLKMCQKVYTRVYLVMDSEDEKMAKKVCRFYKTIGCYLIDEENSDVVMYRQCTPTDEYLFTPSIVKELSKDERSLFWKHFKVELSKRATKEEYIEAYNKMTSKEAHGYMIELFSKRPRYDSEVMALAPLPFRFACAVSHLTMPLATMMNAVLKAKIKKRR